MISAEYFAKQNGVWHRSTPTLENYMRWVNRNVSNIGYPVYSRSSPKRHSLISEAAFYSLFNATEKAESEARAAVARLPRGDEAAARISVDEFEEVQLLQTNLTLYLRGRSSTESTVFQPEFAGCGVVEAARGDIMLGRELIEVKSVQRSFRSTDLRQLLTYSALDYSETQSIDQLTLLNPRSGTYYSTGAEDLALDVGAGSWVELMKDLIEAMTGNEVSL